MNTQEANDLWLSNEWPGLIDQLRTENAALTAEVLELQRKLGEAWDKQGDLMAEASE